MQVKFYFYNNIDEAFFQTIQDVKNSPNSGSEIFAKVLCAQYKNNQKKICIVYTSRTDETTIQRNEEKKLVISLDMTTVNVLSQSVITKQQVYDGEIEVQPLNEYYQGKRVFSNFVNISNYKDCETKECISDYKKCNSNKLDFVDNEIIFSDEQQLPHTEMFCRKIGVDDLVLELNKLNDLDDFRSFIVNVYYDMPDFKEVMRQVLQKASEQTRRNFYLLRGVPEFRIEQVSSDKVEEDLENYINDTDTFYELMKTYKYTIAGGFVLKNILIDKPNYKENKWEDNDIDIWAIRDPESNNYDPFDPLKKLLQKEGYKLKRVCGNKTLKDFEGDYRRLHEYIEQIQEWNKSAYGIDYKIQLILLKDKEANLKSLKRKVRYGVDADLYLKTNGLKYELRTYEDYINDLVLSFDLLCCQCSFSVNNDGNKEIKFYGNVQDYSENESITKSVFEYKTKFSKSCQEKQSLWEWLRSLVRAVKYGKRGFNITNWEDVINTIKPLFSDNPTEDFINYWNNFIGDNIFYKAISNIPIFKVEDNKLYTFTINDRQLTFITDENIEDISPYSNIPKRYDLNPILDFNEDDINMDKLADIVDVNLTNSFFEPTDSEYPTLKDDYVFIDKDENLIDEDNENIMTQQCFDSIEGDYKDVSEVLSKDEDNIVLVSKYGNSYNIECLNRKMLYKVIGDNTKGRYVCLNENKNTGRPIREVGLVMRGWYDDTKIYYRIDTNFGKYYFQYDDILDMMMSREQIFYVVKEKEVERGVAKSVVDNEEKMYANEDYDESYLVSAHHCQEGTAFTIAKLKISSKDVLQQVKSFVREYLDENDASIVTIRDVRRAYKELYKVYPPKNMLRNYIEEYIIELRERI